MGIIYEYDYWERIPNSPYQTRIVYTVSSITGEVHSSCRQYRYEIPFDTERV